MVFMTDVKKSAELEREVYDPLTCSETVIKKEELSTYSWCVLYMFLPILYVFTVRSVHYTDEYQP